MAKHDLAWAETMVTDTASSAPVPSRRRRWIAWGAVALAVALLLAVALHPALRELAGETWREMLSISPAALALIFALKTFQALFAALTWQAALGAAWPRTRLPYRFVLGVEQGHIALNTVAPGRAGTWALLGIFRLSIPGARMPKVLAVWTAQNLAFSLFALVNYALVAFGPPGRTQAPSDAADRVARFASNQPLAAGGIGLALVALAVVAALLARHKLAAAWRQAREGFAILSPPARYVRLVFLPSAVSYAFNCGSYLVLLHAFGIPVTVWTLALALSSNALAGAVKVTPGGIGTSQAIDVIALQAYAPPEVVTAYSLSELAITAVTSATIATVALMSVNGRRGTRVLLAHFRRGEFAAGLRAAGPRRHRPSGDD